MFVADLWMIDVFNYLAAVICLCSWLNCSRLVFCVFALLFAKRIARRAKKCYLEVVGILLHMILDT